MAKADFGCELHQGALEEHRPAIRTRIEREMVEQALARRADVSSFQARTKCLDLSREYSHEALAQHGITAECREELALRTNPNLGRYDGDSVTMIGARKQGRLRKELTFLRRVQHDRVIIDCVSDQSQSALLHLEYAEGLVTLAEQVLAGFQMAYGRALPDRGGKPIKGRHSRSLKFESAAVPTEN